MLGSVYSRGGPELPTTIDQKMAGFSCIAHRRYLTGEDQKVCGMPDMVVADLRWDAAEFVRVGSNPFGSKSAATCAKLSRWNVCVFLAEVLVVGLTECGADRLRSEVRWSCDGQLSDQ